MTHKLPSIRLHPKREASLLRQHPWVFSGALDKLPAGLQDGDLVSVSSSGGDSLGIGLYSSGSIAIKMLSFGQDEDPAALVPSRIQSACSLRQNLGLLRNQNTTGFRLVNAEGDSLPGLIIDYYSGTAVIQFHSLGMWRLRDTIITALKDALGEKLLAVYNKSKTLHEGSNESQIEDGYLLGDSKDKSFREYGLNFIADWEEGQKTGFYLDQRENRNLLRAFSAGKTVLNCFSYTGGFSCAALAGGAKDVTSVDSSARALEILQENLSRNDFPGQHQNITADCLQYLQKLDREYDLIVLDPPAFIKHRGAVRGGIKGYETINHLALKQIKSGGMLFTFSCSQLLSRDEFSDVVARSALRAGRNARVLFELRQAPCHPVNLFHPEGDYLKGLVVEVN